MTHHLSKPYILTLWVLLFPLLSFLLLTDDFRESEFSARLGWILLLTAFAYVVRARWLFLLILLPFVISGIIDLFYTSTFQQQFESPLFKVLHDTDLNESYEFLENYLGAFNAAILVVYLLGFVYLGSKTRMFAPESLKSKLLVSAGALMLVVAVQQMTFYERFKDVVPGALGQIADGYNKHLQLNLELSQRPELLAAYQEPVTTESERPQAYIVVIGESAARKHHNLFGYQRNTNPELTQIKDELILFDDVLSPFAVTYLSLSYTLSEKNINNEIEFSQALSLVGLSKKAGFKTWWISSQPRYEGTTLSLSTVADEAIYVNDNEKKDAAVLAKVERALADKSLKKVIFVHIRGSHMTYSKRYPVEYDVFQDSSNVHIYTDSPSAKQVEVVNAYDNSILFTDHVLSQVIHNLKKAAQESQSVAGLVYFADHGEEVYDYKNFIGHELKRVTPVMFEIPFLVWSNSAYQAEFADKYAAMQQNKHAPFLNDDFFDFGLCFMGIKSNLSARSSSPCEIDYTPKKRLVAGKVYENGSLKE